MVPHSCRKVLIVFWESFLKINRKPSFSLNFEKHSVQTTPRVETDSHFFRWYRFTHVKMRAKDWVKIPRDPQRSQWKSSEPVCYNLWFWSRRREVRFFSKGNQIFSFSLNFDKNSAKTTVRLQMDSCFSNGIVSPVGRLVQNTGSKFQGNPIEAHEKGQNQCVVTFVFRVWGEKLGFSLKAT